MKYYFQLYIVQHFSKNCKRGFKNVQLLEQVGFAAAPPIGYSGALAMSVSGTLSKLLFVKPGVHPVHFEQHWMRSLFNNLTPVDDVNPVCTLDGA